MTAPDPWKPLSPPPAEGPLVGELPAYVSNGLIGLRVLDLPLNGGMAIVSGFVGDHHERHIEAAAATPYPLAGDMALDGLWASQVAGAAAPINQTYDFSTGELTTRFRINLPGGRATVEVLTFASRTHPTLVCQSVAIDLDTACELTFRARVDTTDVRGSMVERRLDTPGEDPAVCDGSILWRSDGALGDCGMALLTHGPEQATRTQEPWDATGPLSTTYRLRASKGRHRFVQIVSLVPDALHHQPQRQAVRLVAASPGFDALRARNRAVWRDLWRGRIQLEGAGVRWQGIADAAFFYLNSSVHASSPASTSIFGLATWRDYHYYFGHVMWDVDAFALPPLSLLQPGAARAMLDFRSKGAEAARKNAQMLGRQGLKFPWEAGPPRGGNRPRRRRRGLAGGSCQLARRSRLRVVRGCDGR